MTNAVAPQDCAANLAGGLPRRWQLVLLLAVAYVLLGAAGILLGAPSPVFPPAGLALAAVLWFGCRALPGIWLGAVVLNLSLNGLGDQWLGDFLDPTTAAVTAAIATGATLQAWIGYRLVIRWQGNAWRAMEGEYDVIRFLLLGGVLAGVVSASFGASALWAAGHIERVEVPYTWWTWYVGDAMGILVFAPLALSLLHRQDVLWRDRRRRILGPMLLTLGLAVMAFFGAQQWERQERQNRIQQSGEAIARDIGNRLMTHREVLSSLRHFIEVTPGFGLQQLERPIRSTLRDNPDIFALSFAELVTDGERPAFEERMSRLSPLGAYRITERDGQQRLVRAAARPEYAPVRMIVPLERNEAAIGFDNYSDPLRRAAAEVARASNRIAVAAPVRLVQQPLQDLGMLEFLPVDARSPTDPNSRPRPLGFVVATVKIDALIAIATQGKIPLGLAIRLSDPEPTTGETLLYRSDVQGSDAAAVPIKDAAWQTVLHVGDRDWKLSVFATPGYLLQHRSWIAWAVGVVGLVFAGMLQILMLGMTGRTHLSQSKNAALLAAEDEIRELNADLELKVEARTAELRKANAELNRLATTDVLTGAWNRRHFEQVVETEMARVRRYGPPLSLLMLDIDYFKSINDRYGHLTGDQVLIEVAQRVRGNLRASDVMARWGGEEFVTLMPHCGSTKAACLAEKLRALIADRPFSEVGAVTASFGVAEVAPDETLDAWLKRVDDALYRAKDGGRNRVAVGEAKVPYQDAVPLNLIWRASYACGEPVIDEEHRALFRLANELLGLAIAEPPLDALLASLDALLGHVREHFAHEEDILRRQGYPDLDRHAGLHRRLVECTLNLRGQVEAGSVEFGTLVEFLSKDVVARHLLQEDRAFFHLFAPSDAARHSPWQA